MRLKVITPPAAESFLELDAVKRHLNVTTSADDVLLTAYIAAAVAKLDGPKGLLGRCLLPTKLRMTMEAFPGEITVPLPPLRSVDFIGYFDPAGVDEEIGLNAYRVSGLEDDAPAVISLPGASRWPPTMRDPEAVTIEFTAGYDAVPSPLYSALMMHVGHLYENREATTSGASVSELPMGYEDAIEPYKVWGCG